jgi:glutathione S-transferase
MTERSIEIPGPDHPITIEANPDRVVVTLGGQSIADTTAALTLREAAYPAVQYIPRRDVDMAALVRSDHTTYCPYKGEASYFSVPAGGDGSVNVVCLIVEKGLDIELAPIDLGAKEQFSDAYLAINPRAVVPTLVLDDGTAIGEFPAIMRYLDEAYPKVRLLGATPKEKALITMWERRAELEGFAAVMEGVRNATAGLRDRAISGPHGYEQIPALIERSKLRVANFYTDFEARLKDAEFVAGDRFSAADITTLVTVDFATKAFAMPLPDDSVALRRWYNAVSARPSAAAWRPTNFVEANGTQSPIRRDN